MIIVWSAVLSILLFLGLIVVILLFGAAANAREKEALERTARDQRAGLTGDISSDTPHSIHQRYLED